MQTIIVVVHLLMALGLIGLVLIQHGKGADAGAAFGSGASATVFGSRGSGSFLTRTTALLAIGFFLTSLGLAYLSGQRSAGPRSVTDVVAPAERIAPEAGQSEAPADLPAAPPAESPADADIPPPPQ